MPTRECFYGLKDYLKIGVPMATQITLDYMVIELQVLLSSVLSISSNAAMVVLINAQIIFFMFPYCMMISANIFVGRSMGANNPLQAKLYSIITTSYSFIVTTIIAIFVLIFRRQVALLITSAPEVVDKAEEGFILIAANLVVVSVSQVLSGVMKGLGKQNTALKQVVFSNYGLGIPLACLLAFYYDLDYIGILIGIITSGILQVILFTFYLTKQLDWEEHA